MKRRPSNDGVLSGAQTMLPMRRSLVRSIMNSLPPEAPRPRTKTKKPGSSPTSGPDEMVLEIRRLSEQQGMSYSSIRNHLAGLGFKLTYERIRQLAEYYTRDHLVPAPNAAPYLTKESSCTT